MEGYLRAFQAPQKTTWKRPLDLHEFLIDNKAATFLMRVDGDSMKDAGILHGDLLVLDRAATPANGSGVTASAIRSAAS